MPYLWLTRLLHACSLLLLLLCLPLTVQAHYADADGDASLHTVREDMLAIVHQLLATLTEEPGAIENAVGYDRSAALQLAMADAARRNFVYWPYLRSGLALEFMTAEQKALTHDLLNTALSAKGYLSSVQIMQMEEILASTEVSGFPRGSENYTLALFGEPGMDSEWGWRFEGHHLSLNFTLAPTGISVTPSFWGAAPAAIDAGNMTGFRNLRSIHEAGQALINALSPAQQERAIETGNPPFDIVSGTLNKPREEWDDWQQLGNTGIALNSLDEDQQALAQRIIDEVITAYRPEISRAYLAQIDVSELWFTWFGGTGTGEPHYYRLDGPDFFFEYDLVQGNGNHVHTVWRSKSGDFGSDLLLRHRHDDH